ncbi:hypothetical protein HY380_00920 [Candidatus Saccharibacteria bacterium]|nr:hypothetical protein [Candidatus Saccharibacteria bacterium]
MTLAVIIVFSVIATSGYIAAMCFDEWTLGIGVIPFCGVGAAVSWFTWWWLGPIAFAAIVLLLLAVVLVFDSLWWQNRYLSKWWPSWL